jgi:pilus assembly protein CpaB
MLSLALACGGLAASQVRARVERVERQVGPLVPAIVARGDLPADTELSPRRLALRRVPRRFVPRDSLAVIEEAAGLRTAVPVPAGAYVTAGALQGAGRRGAPSALRRGERAVEIGVAAGEPLSEAATPGARVDVLVSTEPEQGEGRTFLALQGVELLGLRPGEGEAALSRGGEERAPAATAIASLRVTLRQAVYLTAAQNFAREVRLLPRPSRDRGRDGQTEVAADDL